MENVIIEFSKQEIEKLKTLIREFDSFYDYDEIFDNETENWQFEDVDAQRQIALTFADILRDKV